MDIYGSLQSFFGVLGSISVFLKPGFLGNNEASLEIRPGKNRIRDRPE
jgi:hypothetical protein